MIVRTRKDLRQKAPKTLLRVTLPDGRVICHKSATMTFTEALAEIGPEHFNQIQIEHCHLPLLSEEIYPRFEKFMKQVCDGWYVNTQSDTHQKYLQLVSIVNQLGIDMQVETGTDFITSDKKVPQKSKKRDQKLLVKFPDGEYIGETNPIDTFLQTIFKIGVEELKRKEFEFRGKPMITHTKQYEGQIQVGDNRWIIIPPQTKDKYKVLLVISSLMRLNLEVSII